VISDLTALFLTAIVFGAIGVVSATRFALSALMLTDQTAAWARALGFAVGTTVVFAIAAVLGTLGVEIPGAGSPSPTVNLIPGITMVVAAGVMLLMRRRQMADPDADTGPSRHPTLASAGLGAGVALQSVGRLLILVGAGYRIGTLARTPTEAIGAIALMLVIWQVPVWAPMALYVFRRDRFDALAARARPALDRIEGGIFGVVLIAAVGVFFIILGLTGF
jgi:hypothetical protein